MQMYYLRRITRGKWTNDIVAPAELEAIPADTVLSEFNTKNNMLSIWSVESEQDINDVFIALASNRANISTISVVEIDPKDLEGLRFNDDEGDTPTFDINQKHRNMW